MTDKIADEFFTADHDRLARIANIANFVAWIVFIVNILLVGAKFVEAQDLFNAQSIMLAHAPDFGDFLNMLSQKPLYAASLFVDMLSIFLQGVVYGLTLKGISLGLNMIIEIDLDNKEKSALPFLL